MSLSCYCENPNGFSMRYQHLLEGLESALIATQIEPLMYTLANKTHIASGVCTCYTYFNPTYMAHLRTAMLPLLEGETYDAAVARHMHSAFHAFCVLFNQDPEKSTPLINTLVAIHVGMLFTTEELEQIHL